MTGTWRVLRQVCSALRDVHREQMLMWELFWQAGRATVPEVGPLAWVPSLDGPRLGGSYLPDTSAISPPS
jgi:hypothetical protein